MLTNNWTYEWDAENRLKKGHERNVCPRICFTTICHAVLRKNLPKAEPLQNTNVLFMTNYKCIESLIY